MVVLSQRIEPPKAEFAPMVDAVAGQRA